MKKGIQATTPPGNERMGKIQLKLKAKAKTGETKSGYSYMVVWDGW